MFCENCGTRLNDGERFCSNCGSPVVPAQQNTAAPAAPQAQPAASYAPAEPASPYAQPASPYEQPASPYEQPASPYGQPAASYEQPAAPYAPQVQNGAYNYAPQFNPQPQPKAKSSKKRTGILIGAIALVLVAAFVVTAFATGLFGSKDSGVAALEKKSLRGAINAYHEIVDTDALEDGATYTVSLKPGTYLKSLAAAQGLDLTWLNNAKIELATDNDDDTVAAQVKLVLNDTDIFRGAFSLDAESGEVLLDLGDLADGVAQVNLYELTSGLSSSSYSSMMNLLESYSSSFNFESVDKILDLSEKYYGIVINAMGEAQEADGTLTANGVSQSCKTYTLNVTQRTLLDIVKAVLNSVADDGDIKSLLKDNYDVFAQSMGTEDMDFDEWYSQMRTAVKQYSEQADAYADQFTDETLFTLVDYVSDGGIIGRRFTMGSSSLYFLSASTDVFFGLAQDGDRFGAELTVNGETYMTGSGAKNGSTVNGTFQIYYDDMQLFDVELIDYDTEKYTGAVTLSLSSGAWNMLSGNRTLASALGAATLRFDFTESGTNLDVQIASQSLFEASVTRSAKQSISINGSSAVTDLEAWSSSIDTVALIQHLAEAGVPQEFLQSMTQSLR